MREYSQSNVTVFADASASHTTKVAGYGGWAKRGAASAITTSGPVKYTTDVALIELRSLVKVCATLVKVGYIKPDDCVMLQTDSADALRRIYTLKAYAARTVRVSSHKDSESVTIERNRKPPCADSVEAITILFRLLQKNDLVLRHVRGHQRNGKGGRYYVNNLCDKLANKERKLGEKLHENTR